MVADLARIRAVSYVCSSLFTRPSRESLESRVDRLKERIVDFREKVASFIADSRVFVYLDVAAKCVWISFLVVPLLTLVFKPSLINEKGHQLISDLLKICDSTNRLLPEILWLVSFLERYLGLESLREQVLAKRAAEENRQLCKNLIHFLETFREELGEVGDLQPGFHLLHLQKIPEPLFEDALFKRFICPITQKPIRYPVIDANDNKVYEREAIVDWLKTHSTSPVSSHTLDLRDLAPKSDLKAMIDMRLRFYEKRLQDYIQESEVGQGVREIFQSSLQRSLPSNQEIPRHLLFNGEQVFDVSATAALDGVLLTPKPLYESLSEYLQSRPDIRDSEGRFNILALKEIPALLHPDAIFSCYICPITKMPIRHPVGDPTSHVVYERQAILNWLRVRSISPVTCLPLLLDQLVEKPGLQALIDHRLRFHEIELEKKFVASVN